MKKDDKQVQCEICKVFTTNLTRHLQRNRCAAVKARRLDRLS